MNSIMAVCLEVWIATPFAAVCKTWTICSQCDKIEENSDGMRVQQMANTEQRKAHQMNDKAVMLAYRT